MPIARNWDKKFFDAWSPEMAYVLGFMFADGYVYKNSSGGWYLCICSTDLELVKAIRNVWQSEHKIGVKLPSLKFHRLRSLYTVQIGSKVVCERLASFGVVQNKSLTVVFPKVPVAFLGCFVRGYFDGDGCVSFKRYWRKDREQWKYQLTVRFTSGSRDFLEGLWRSLSVCTVEGGHINKKQRGYELVFSQHDSFALYDLMYDNIPSRLFLKRKFRVFIRAARVLRS